MSAGLCRRRRKDVGLMGDFTEFYEDFYELDDEGAEEDEDEETEDDEGDISD